MIYLFEKELKDNKKVKYELRKVFGLGPQLVNKLCNKYNFHENLTIGELTTQQIQELTNGLVKSKLPLEIKLRNRIHERIDTLITLKCYRGIRHGLCLPVRGQRTHTNAQTQKKLAVNRLLQLK